MLIAIGFLLVLLPCALGVVPVFVARSRPARLVAGVFGLTSLAFAIYLIWGIAHAPFPRMDIPIIGALSTALVSAVVTYVLDKWHVWKASPLVTKRKELKVAGGCLFIVVAFVLFGVSRYFHLRSPHFSGSAPLSIEITIRSPDSPTTESKVLVQASITNGPACAPLFALLRSARFRMDHKCADIGSFTIRYANGKTDTLAVLPGHDPAAYEFRFGGRSYQMPREGLYQVLRDAGVDTTKMPESEH